MSFDFEHAFQHRDKITILAYDPGVGHMGYAVIDWRSCTPLDFVVRVVDTIDGAKCLKTRKELRRIVSPSYVILDAYYDMICEHITLYQPDVVVSEGAFQHRFVQAFASLTLVIHTIRRASIDILHQDIVVVAPRETKTYLGVKNASDKAEVKIRIVTDQHIHRPTEDPDAISEHGYDAIGHGVGYIRKALLKKEP